MEDKKIILTTLSPNTHRTSEENLGIECLKSSLVKAGYDVQIIDAWINEYTVDQVYEMISSQIDDVLFVGISSYMSNTLPTIELATKLKKKNSDIKIVCGGFGPTFYPKQYLEHNVDIVIKGEGEDAIVDLANCLKNNEDYSNVKNLCFKKDNEIVINEMRCLEDNLDKYPFPSRDVIDVVMDKKSTVNMVTARGCSGNCTFCSVISFFRMSNGKVWRSRSISNIVDEIEELSQRGVTHIKMVDDSFVDGYRDENWCEEFADEVNKRNINVNLRGQIRADRITDKVLYELKRAGFYSFACGIENGSQSALSRMNKMATLEDNVRALELFKKHDYIVQMGYILFDKYTTYEELLENYNFLYKYSFALTKGIFSEMFSAEGTKLNDKLKKDGDLIEKDFTGNNAYIINDSVVRDIHDALKKWHKSHSEIYDMTIDPIIAPKAIDKEHLKEFYKEALSLRKNDLKIFKQILELKKQNKNYNIMEYVDNEINVDRENYGRILKKVNKLYDETGLVYNAVSNPFI